MHRDRHRRGSGPSSDIPPTDVRGTVDLAGNGTGTFSPESCTLERVTLGESACIVEYTAEARDSGIHTLRAFYRGDAGHATSQTAIPVTVLGLTRTTLHCTPATVDTGRESTCTATVTDLSLPSTGSPGTEVRFESQGPLGSFPGGEACTLSATAQGEASCSVTFSPAESGSFEIIAAYEGEATRLPSEGAATVLDPDPTTTAVNCDRASAAVGTTTTCRATVTDAAGEPSVPSGAVRLTSDGRGVFANAAGCESLSPAGADAATCEFSYEPTDIGSGSHRIAVAYDGDGAHRASDGATPLTVFRPAALSCEPAKVTVGRPSTCTATVFDASATPSPPSGAVAFASNDQGGFGAAPSCDLRPAGADRASCQLAYTPTAVGSRHHGITASYAGDTTHGPTRVTAVVEVAGASVRYAAPGGTGKDPCADPKAPCSLYTAADSKVPGDEREGG